MRSLQNSQSASELSRDHDLLDASELLLPRSSSLNVIESYADERMVITELHEEMAISELNYRDAGAARLRDLPVRKTRANRATAVTAGTTVTKRATRGASKSKQTDLLYGDGGGGIRGRRKLREATPDVDVEGD